jgi:hypothetical protein
LHKLDTATIAIGKKALGGDHALTQRYACHYARFFSIPGVPRKL